MYHILPESSEHLVAICMEGVISVQDYQTLLPHIKRHIEQYDRIRILIELKNFQGIQPSAILRLLPYAFKYSKYIEKKAFITDERWVYGWAKFFRPFLVTQVRCFSPTNLEEAWKWLKK